MDFTAEFTLPFSLGGTTEENIKLSEESSIVQKHFGSNLECFIDTSKAVPGGDIEKIVSMVETGRCVTAQLLLFEPDTHHTFLGIPLEIGNGNDEESFSSALRELGVNCTVEEHTIVLTDEYVTIELSDYVCWYDRNFWSHSDFLEETLSI
jgi:hypothetical protein